MNTPSSRFDLRKPLRAIGDSFTSTPSRKTLKDAAAVFRALFAPSSKARAIERFLPPAMRSNLPLRLTKTSMSTLDNVRRCLSEYGGGVFLVGVLMSGLDLIMSLGMSRVTDFVFVTGTVMLFVF